MPMQCPWLPHLTRVHDFRLGNSMSFRLENADSLQPGPENQPAPCQLANLYWPQTWIKKLHITQARLIRLKFSGITKKDVPLWLD